MNPNHLNIVNWIYIVGEQLRVHKMCLGISNYSVILYTMA